MGITGRVSDCGKQQLRARSGVAWMFAVHVSLALTSICVGLVCVCLLRAVVYRSGHVHLFNHFDALGDTFGVFRLLVYRDGLIGKLKVRGGEKENRGNLDLFGKRVSLRAWELFEGVCAHT